MAEPLFVFMPVYNERDNPLISRLDLIIADGGSTLGNNMLTSVRFRSVRRAAPNDLNA